MIQIVYLEIDQENGTGVSFSSQVNPFTKFGSIEKENLTLKTVYQYLEGHEFQCQFGI